MCLTTYTPQVVLKTLRVAKYCCENGHATFRRGIQRRVAELRPFLGALSHLRG